MTKEPTLKFFGFVFVAAVLLSGFEKARAADSFAYCMDVCLQDHSCSITSQGDNYCQVTKGDCNAKCSRAGSGRTSSTTYGALAYGPDTGATGWSYNWGSESQANQSALKACGAKAKDCVVTWSLTPTSTGTHLRMEQSGFRADQQQAYQGAQYGWQKFFANLEQLLAKTP